MQPAEDLNNKLKEFWPKDGPPTNEVNKYIKKYSKEKIVIKCGGRVLLDPDLFNNFINGVQFVHLRVTKNGYKYVLNNTATNLLISS